MRVGSVLIVLGVVLILLDIGLSAYSQLTFPERSGGIPFWLTHLPQVWGAFIVGIVLIAVGIFLNHKHNKRS